MCLSHDPFQQLAKEALAVVLSTPDREKHNSHHLGPPSQPYHVREWLLEELEVMVQDYGMFPVSGGWECPHKTECATGYWPQNTTHATSVLFISNTQVRTYF